MAKKKNTGGRPRFFSDPHKRRKFLLLLKSGASRPDACASVGVSTQTMYVKIREDQQFANDVTAAEIDGKLFHMMCIAAAATGRKGTKTQKEILPDWKASAWFLERKHWKEFARRSPDAVTPEMLASVFANLSAKLVQALPAEFHDAVRQVFEFAGIQSQGKRDAAQ